MELSSSFIAPRMRKLFLLIWWNTLESFGHPLTWNEDIFWTLFSPKEISSKTLFSNFFLFFSFFLFLRNEKERRSYASVTYILTKTLLLRFLIGNNKEKYFPFYSAIDKSCFWKARITQALAIYLEQAI